MDRETIKVVLVLIFAFVITGLGNHFIDGMTGDKANEEKMD